MKFFILILQFLSKDGALFFGVEIEKSIYYKKVLSTMPFLSLKWNKNLNSYLPETSIKKISKNFSFF